MSAVPNLTSSPVARPQRPVSQQIERVEYVIQAALMLLAAGTLLAAVLRPAGETSGTSAREAFAHAVPVIVGIVTLLAGASVTYRRQHDVVGRVFAMLCATLALSLAAPLKAWTVAVPLAGGLLLTFALVYPSQIRLIAGRPVLRWLPMPAILLTLAILAIVPPAREAITIGFGVLTGLGAIIILGLRAMFASAPTVRERSRIALPATAVAFGPLFMRASGLWQLPLTWGMLALTTFPVTIAVSERHQQPIDARQVFGVTTAYGTIAAIVAAGYALLVAGLNVALGRRLPATNPFLVALLSVILVAGLEPLRQYLQARIDRIFFRSRASYEDRISTFRRDLVPLDTLDDVVQLLKQQVREGLLPSHVYVFLQDALSGDYVAAGDAPQPDTDIRFETDSSLVRKLSTSQGPLYFEFNKPLPQGLASDHARLSIIRTPVVAPLLGQTGLLGFVAIGPMRSGEEFQLADLHFAQELAEQASFAVARSRVAEDLERREHELDVLSQIAQAINFATEPEPLMELVYVQATKLFDMTAFSVIEHHADARALGCRFYACGDKRDTERVGQFWPDAVGLAGEVIRSGRPIMTRDYPAECAHRGVKPHEAGARAWMGVPLNSATQTLGVLAAMNNGAGAAFSEQQLNLLWAIADLMATALERTRLSSQAEARARQIAILDGVMGTLSPTLKMDRLLPSILEAATNLMGSEVGALYLLDEEATELVLQAIVGDSDELAGTRLPLGVGTAGQAVEAGAPIIHNVAAPGISAETPLRRLHADSILAVPLRANGTTLGAIEVVGRRDGTPFSNEETTLLMTFAGQASAAIENAQLLQSEGEDTQSRAELISFVSHELKNPLTSIRGYTDLLKSGELGEINEAQLQFLTTIRNNIDRMSHFIIDLADVARIEAGRLTLDPEPTSVEVIVEETLGSLEANIARKGQSLSVKLETNLPLIDADPTRMVQVLTNLVSNASKYTPEGGRIMIGAARQAIRDPQTGQQRRVVHHWVRDNGIGIDQADVGRIFESFFRTSAARDMAPGTGLGLSIVHNLVEQHGGQIWVESVPGSGSTFHYTIPASDLPH